MPSRSTHNIGGFLAGLRADIDEETRNRAEYAGRAARDYIASETPVLTGQLQGNWELTLTDDGFILDNATPYGPAVVERNANFRQALERLPEIIDRDLVE